MSQTGDFLLSLICSKKLEQNRTEFMVSTVDSVSPVSAQNTSLTLSEFQREVIAFFVHAAQALDLPKSVGEIYGLLFSSKEPLSLDEIVALLEISKGSASQGLRFLENLMAVERVRLEEERRDRFVAELRLRRLVTGFLRERAEPHLATATERLERLADAATPVDAEFAQDRVKRLRSWHKRANLLLPLIRRVLAAP